MINSDICLCVLMITRGHIITAYHNGIAAVNERGTCRVDVSRRLKDNPILWLSRISWRPDFSSCHIAKRRPMSGLRFLGMRIRNMRLFEDEVAGIDSDFCLNFDLICARFISYRCGMTTVDDRFGDSASMIQVGDCKFRYSFRNKEFNVDQTSGIRTFYVDFQ